MSPTRGYSGSRPASEMGPPPYQPNALPTCACPHGETCLDPPCAICEGSSPDLTAAAVLGPDDWLVLVARQSITLQQIELWRAHIPEALRGRIVIVDQMDAFIVPKETP